MKLSFIKEQMLDVDRWTARMIDDFEESNWGMIDALGTSVNWQVGHIVISKYFHSVQSVLDSDHDIIKTISQRIPLQDFFNYYAHGSKPSAEWSHRPGKVQLLEWKKEVDLATDGVLTTLTDENLLESTSIRNPVAKTKYDALIFCFKHQMWHNGQIAMMQRIIS